MKMDKNDTKARGHGMNPKKPMTPEKKIPTRPVKKGKVSA